MNVNAPLYAPSLAAQNLQLQQQNQNKLLTLAARSIDEVKNGQVNPVVSQQLANLATASGLGGNINYQT